MGIFTANRLRRLVPAAIVKPRVLRYASVVVGVVMCALPAAAAFFGADSRVQTLTRAQFVLSEATTPPGADRASPVTLPDDWALSRPDAVGSGWYLLEWVPPANPAPICAVYLTGISVPTEVYVNGHLVGATGALSGPRPLSWQQSQLFVIPASVMQPGANQIALRVHVKAPGAGDMGPVLAGPEPALRDHALGDLFLYTLGPAVVSVTIVVLGLFIIILWLRRRDPTYGLFGFAAMLWGVHTALSLLSAPLFPQPHWYIAWTSLYLLFVALLCLFCLRFAEADWPVFRRIIVGYVLAAPVLLYVAKAFGVVNAAANAMRMGAIVLVFIALGAVARYALRKRDTESMLLLFAGAVSLAFGIHDWTVNQYSHDVRNLMLVPYAGLAFLLLVGWILTDRFVRALNEFEVLNAGLEQRVAEKSEALNEQLAQTRAARDAAESADRSKSRFLAAASHDLRQPLHALGLFAARLGDRTRDPEDSALVQRITTSIASLESLFSALLDISKLEAGVVAAEPRPMALAPLFERLANDFAPEAAEKNLKFTAVPTHRAVHSDPVLLERILRNLVASALRYTAAGGVVIGARRRGASVAIEVWDSGPGIPHAEVERVFEEFYQVGNPARDRTRGLGLGLAIVRRLARLLDHQVTVRSRPGRGSMFRLLATEVPPERVAAVARAAPLQHHDPLSGRRVLVIDDEEPVREGMRQTLEAWGCVPLIAATADEALELCADGSPPDAMLVDFLLPGGRDGIAAIEMLRSSLGHAVPAIIVSGESSSEELARIERSGFVLLHKPIAPARLRAALSYLLAQMERA